MKLKFTEPWQPTGFVTSVFAARTTMLNVPLVVGVPLIVAVVGLVWRKFTPVGRAPDSVIVNAAPPVCEAVNVTAEMAVGSRRHCGMDVGFGVTVTLFGASQ